MNRYVKVIFETSSGADNHLNYKIDEINLSKHWNPSARNPREMGGFNFSTEDKIFRWLIRGDTLYEVEIPDDAEVIDCPSKSAPHGVFRSNQIILHNPKKITDHIALDLYKKSKLPAVSYYKALAGCAIRGYRNTCLEVIKDKVNKNNIDFVLSEIDDFVSPFRNGGAQEKLQVYDEVMILLNHMKD